jgi:transposase
MSDVKFIGLDVHKTSISAAVLNESGKLVMQAVFMTNAAAVVGFLHGVPGTVRVTFEEGTHAAWLYTVLKSQVADVVVCNPRKNALLKSGNKSDQIDARKLAELLRTNLLSGVYHDDTQTLTLKELGRSYRSLTDDTTRVMRRLKALYRSLALDTGGKKLYTRRRREQWLSQLKQAGQRYRAERMFEQLDSLQALRRQIRSDLIQEGRKHTATEVLSSIPFVGPIRSALLIARVQTPFRFRTKRQFWAYCGLALETRSSADHQVIDGELRRKTKPVFIRGLNLNHNPDLKNIFKSAATTASASPGPLRDFYENLLGKGMKPEMARLTLARKIAAISLSIWKKGERFDPEQLKIQAA